MLSRFLTLLVAGATLACLASAASAQETTLIFATLTPTDGHQNMDVFHPWADHINQVAKGVLHIDVRDGFAIASRTNFYNRVLDDVVQIAWGPQGSIGGQFPRSDVVEMPFEADTSAVGSVAFWRLYKTGLLDPEYKDILPLWMVDETQASLHMVKAPSTLDNLKGLKILVPDKGFSTIVEYLAGTPLAIPLEDSYTSLQRHTVDGMTFPWTGLQTFRLADVTFYHVNLSLGGAAGMVFMSRKKFNSLSPAVQKILMDNSSEAMALNHAQSLDEVQNQVREQVQADPKQKVVTLTPAEEATWRKRLAPYAQAWAKSVPDGEKVLAAYRELVAKVKSGN